MPYRHRVQAHNHTHAQSNCPVSELKAGIQAAEPSGYLQDRRRLGWLKFYYTIDEQPGVSLQEWIQSQTNECADESCNKTGQGLSDTEVTVLTPFEPPLYPLTRLVRNYAQYQTSSQYLTDGRLLPVQR